MSYYDYSLARPNETKLLEHLENEDADWHDIAESLLRWMSDDEVGEWAKYNGYLDDNDKDDD